MAEEGNVPKELATGVRGLVDRIGEFFHLFDLSFFVSGAATFSALAYWFSQQGSQVLTFPTTTWIRVTAIIVACYIAGLLSFAAGRLCAALWRRRPGSDKKYLPEFLKKTVKAHGIPEVLTDGYLKDESDIDKPWRFYERLWVDLRESREHAASFSLVNRYWVMAATYDGIAISSLTWMVAVILEPPVAGNNGGRFVLPILAAAAALLSFWQGHNYFKYQVHEMVATLASSVDRLMKEDRSAGR